MNAFLDVVKEVVVENQVAVVLALIMVAEKMVKLSRSKYDDIIVDIIGAGLKKALGVGKAKEESL